MRASTKWDKETVGKGSGNAVYWQRKREKKLSLDYANSENTKREEKKNEGNSNGKKSVSP